MRDPRHERLARILVHHSTKVKKGEVVLVNGIGFDTYPLARTVARCAAEAGGIPLLRMEETDAARDLMLAADETQLQAIGGLLLEEMKRAQVYIGIRGAKNAYELADVPRDRMEIYNRVIQKPVHLERRVKHTRWCVLRYPNNAMAQLASISTDVFEDYYFDVCTVDYPAMEKAVEPLKKRMVAVDRVRITAPGTDLRFSIKGIGVVACSGQHNIPDGECFTAPVRESIEGAVAFNTPTIYEGRAFEKIRLWFEKGRVVRCEDGGGNTEELEKILNRDEGSRYVGEWSIAYHPVIRKPMRDILFDEKIGGSWHMALGQCYDEAPNGNTSGLHWDLVQIQRADCGGGTIEFDGATVRRDGLFVVDDLKPLNPERLTLGKSEE